LLAKVQRPAPQSAMNPTSVELADRNRLGIGCNFHGRPRGLYNIFR
jgi:hypothetical protein